MADAGSEGRRLRGRLRAASQGRPCAGHDVLHDRAAPLPRGAWASARATRSSCRRSHGWRRPTQSSTAAPGRSSRTSIGRRTTSILPTSGESSLRVPARSFRSTSSAFALMSTRCEPSFPRASPSSRTRRAPRARSLEGAPQAGLGDLAAFSFHPRKSITTGEGGMVTTNDAELAETRRSSAEPRRVGVGGAAARRRRPVLAAGVRGHRLQLPDVGSPSGRRPGSARPARWVPRRTRRVRTPLP